MTTYIPKCTVGMLCFITAAVLFICWLLAAVCDPSWSFGTSSISDLGTSEVESAKVIFNIGFCVLGGALVIIIGALYLFTKKSRLLHAVYGVLIVAGGIALICVGLNPADVNDDIHTWCARITYLIIAVLYILTTAESWLDKKYFVASLLTTGILLAIILKIGAADAAAETSVIVFYLLLLAHYGIIWSTKKPDAVVNLYGNEVKI